MKTISQSVKSANYTTVSIGMFDKLSDYQFVVNSKISIPGKVFLGEDLKATGVEISMQLVSVGESIGFFHAHKQNEEVFVVIKGGGEFLVDEEVFPIEEGGFIRVAPNGVRSFRNTGSIPLIMMCIQAKEHSLEAATLADGYIVKRVTQ